jgi:hypothetical protein
MQVEINPLQREVVLIGANGHYQWFGSVGQRPSI